MALYGLLGEHLGHSWSPQIHKALAGYDYDLFSLPPEALGEFLATTPCRGLNVTIPYKKAVIPYCASLSPAAERLGAVNTLVRTPAGWHGDNTDYAGFRALCAEVSPVGLHAAVLGSGGAGVMAAQALRDLGAASVQIVSRSGPVNYENLDRNTEFLVNATPVGMFPRNGERPVDLAEFPRCRGVIDLIYNPQRTAFVLDAEARGIPAVGGLWMLVVQALHAARQFCPDPILQTRAEAVYRQLRAQMQNIILIGMPGCGKSTVGRLLARRLGREFFDTDAVITERYGPIPDIFIEQGEDAFRRKETAVLGELGQRSGCVIATGGGVVTRPENHPLARQNGIIIRLTRPLDQLPTAGRPLSQAHPLEVLLAQREPMYRAWADHTIENSGHPAATVQKILEAIS